MKLDGKKKWTAALIAIAGTVVAQFAPEQESAIMETVQTMAPMVIGGIYIIMQWMHDDKKETVKVEQEKTIQVQAQAQAQLKTPDPELADETPPAPFDPAAFDEKVEHRAPEVYLDANDMTRFFAARDLGARTPCTYLNKAVDYWLYLLDKAHKAFICKFGFPYNEAEKHLGDDKSCPYYSVDNMARQRGIDYYAMLRQLRWAERKVNDVEELSETDIDWYAKLERPTLYSVGNLARQLLNHNT